MFMSTGATKLLGEGVKSFLASQCYQISKLLEGGGVITPTSDNPVQGTKTDTFKQLDVYFSCIL